MAYQVRLLALLAVALVPLVVLACSGGDEEDATKLRVVATTTQIGDFAREVGGDRIALTVLLRPNQDAHDFEAEPSQIRALERAQLVLRNGVGLDAFVIKALAGSDAAVVIVSQGIELRAGEEEGRGADEEAAGRDPHVWFSVANAKRMVENVRDALAAADATNAEHYHDNAKAYLARLDQLEQAIRTAVGSIPAACRKLVTNHDVLGYYADAYGFEIVGSVIPSTTTEARASAADVAEIVRKIRAENVPAIFAEASVNPGLIRQVGREAGVKVVDDLYGDSLGPAGSDGATYVAMMESNTRKIAEALKECG